MQLSFLLAASLLLQLVAVRCNAAVVGDATSGVSTHQTVASSSTTTGSHASTTRVVEQTPVQAAIEAIFASMPLDGGSTTPKLNAKGASTGSSATSANKGGDVIGEGDGDSTHPKPRNNYGHLSTKSDLKIDSISSLGVVYNYLESDLVAKGFVKCYDQPYLASTSSNDLAQCSGSQFVFVGAKSSAESATFTIGAFGLSANVFRVTSSLSQALYDSEGGAYWYLVSGKSFGFADNSVVNLNSCDYNNPDCTSRLCWHLDQNVGGYRAGCSVGLNSDSTWRKVMYKSALPSCGVLHDYKEAELLTKNYVKCYDQPYSSYTSSADLAACSGSEYVFVGAKSSIGSTTFDIGAFGVASNVLQTTSSSTFAFLDAGGAYWYRYPGWSFGFSSSSTVNLNSCDYNLPDCSGRLCWHLDQNIGGYRAGCSVALNSDQMWWKVIYKGSNLPTCPPPAVPSCGVLHSYPEHALLLKNFVKCYDAPYSAATTSADLGACSGTSLLFVGAKVSEVSDVIDTGAFGVSSNVLKTTSSTTQAYLDAGGAYWYRYPGWSFGFSSSSTVNLYSCDYNLPDCSNRLCWHLDQNVGGYRSGCTVGLNGDTNWRKVIYKGDFVNSCSPDVMVMSGHDDTPTTGKNG